MTAFAARHKHKTIIERRLALAALVLLVLAWIGGSLRSASSVVPYLPQALPGAQRFEPVANGIHAGYAQGSTTPIGYVAVGEAAGYGGPMKVAVGVDPQGKVLGLAIIEQRESPAWISLMASRQFDKRLIGASFSDPLTLGQDIDAISGATYTTRAIVDAVRQASRQVATQQLALPVPPQPAQAVQFGVPEIALLMLFAAGFVGRQRAFPFKKQLRWIALIAGMIVLGFLYNSPLTLSNINALLLGFWPQWQTHLYWYLLLGGVLLFFIFENKNPYCDWICPFGAAQECLGALAGAESHSRNPYREPLLWLQRGLALAAIALAFFFRNPSLTSFEVFGVFFKLRGSPIQFVLLFVVLSMSLVFKRPWCAYLCPLRPVTDYVRLMRTWIIELWQRKRPTVRT